MPKPPRTTTDPIGAKLLQVLREKGHEDDLNHLAQQFGVKVQSTYDWINHGRISKDRYSTLVQWSGRPLEWWFDVQTTTTGNDATTPLLAMETAGLWPFNAVSRAEWAILSAIEKAQVEGFVKGLILAKPVNQFAA